LNFQHAASSGALAAFKAHAHLSRSDRRHACGDIGSGRDIRPPATVLSCCALNDNVIRSTREGRGSAPLLLPLTCIDGLAVIQPACPGWRPRACACPSLPPALNPEYAPTQVWYLFGTGLLYCTSALYLHELVCAASRVAYDSARICDVTTVIMQISCPTSVCKHHRTRHEGCQSVQCPSGSLLPHEWRLLPRGRDDKADLPATSHLTR
jgi:hypothetical protein